MEGTRTKVSITLAPDLVQAVDRAAKRAPGGNRSAVIEAWLRRALRMELEDKLRADTIAYYEGLSVGDRREHAAIGRASSRAARRLRIDDR